MVKIVYCRGCGNPIASNTKVCPYCGEKNKRPIYKKTWFWIVIVVLFIIGATAGSGESGSTNDGGSRGNSSVGSSVSASKETTLQDVQNWYESQTSAVSKCLIEYAEAIDGVSGVKVDSCKFRFGGDSGWYDCHYTVVFNCKINGVKHIGEARGFLKYQEDTINWFHFEIFSNTGVQSLVEHYDDSYDDIIEDYYKELEGKYK